MENGDQKLVLLNIPNWGYQCKTCGGVFQKLQVAEKHDCGLVRKIYGGCVNGVDLNKK